MPIPPDPSMHPKRHRSPALRILFFILILYVIGSAVYGAVYLYHTAKNPSQINAETYSPTEYQAVFLDNNQVYFGKITNISATTITMTNIYYLNPATTPQSTATPGISLVKLGSEIHAPEDEMFITLSHVLYYENLQPASKVAKAIEADQKK